MKLTKEQIDYIENRLIKNGIKYWDIRIELLDHVVSDVESKLETQEDFKKTVHTSFVFLGWNGSFEDVIRERKLLINRKYRKIYNTEFVNFFKSIKNVIIFTSFFVFYHFLFTRLSDKVFEKTPVLITLFTSFLFLIIAIVHYLKKNGKSIQLEYGIFYLLITGLLFNSILQQVEVVYSFFLIPFYLVFTYAGYKTYMKAKQETEKTYRELQKL